MTSAHIGKTILIKPEFENITFTYYKSEEFNYLDFLKLILYVNDLKLNYQDNVYYIDSVKSDDIVDTIAIDGVNSYLLKLKYINYDDIKNLLDILKIEHQYIESFNALFINSTLDDYTKVSNFISELDQNYNEVTIKLSIYEINLGKLKDFKGVINANLTDSSKFALDVILGGISFSKVPTNEIPIKSYESILSFLYNNNISKVLTNTVLTLTNNKTSYLNSSQNIPFLTSSNTITDTRQNQINQIDYKDVGLEIFLKPLITDEKIAFELDFKHSQLLSSNDNKPITTKKSLKQFVTIDKTKPYHIIAGINNFSNTSFNDKVPYLGDVPILGWLFKNEKIDYSTTTTTIFIELIQNNQKINHISNYEKEVKEQFSNIKQHLHNQTLKELGF